jgi:excisionase family DNA binding protein
MPEKLRRLYTIADVRDATSFSDSTIRRAIRLKQLAVIRMGRSIRLTQSDVDAWLDRSRRKAR